MAANKRSRKAYRPRPVSDPLALVISGLYKIDPHHLTDLNVKNHAAMLSITSGHGTRDHFDKLVGCMNMGLVMAEMGMGREYRPLLQAGQDAMFALGRRFLKSDRFVFTGPELHAMNEALSVHDAQLDASRVIDVERAYDEVLRRLRNKIDVKRIVEPA